MSYFALTGNLAFYTKMGPYDENETKWEYSLIRNWVNNSFYSSAFTENEQQLITLTTVSNNCAGSYDAEDSNTKGTATEDYIYSVKG